MTNIKFLIFVVTYFGFTECCDIQQLMECGKILKKHRKFAWNERNKYCKVNQEFMQCAEKPLKECPSYKEQMSIGLRHYKFVCIDTPPGLQGCNKDGITKCSDEYMDGVFLVGKDTNKTCTNAQKYADCLDKYTRSCHPNKRYEDYVFFVKVNKDYQCNLKLNYPDIRALDSYHVCLEVAKCLDEIFFDAIYKNVDDVDVLCKMKDETKKALHSCLKLGNDCPEKKNLEKMMSRFCSLGPPNPGACDENAAFKCLLNYQKNKMKYVAEGKACDVHKKHAECMDKPMRACLRAVIHENYEILKEFEKKPYNCAPIRGPSEQSTATTKGGEMIARDKLMAALILVTIIFHA